MDQATIVNLPETADPNIEWIFYLAYIKKPPADHGRELTKAYKAGLNGDPYPFQLPLWNGGSPGHEAYLAGKYKRDHG